MMSFIEFLAEGIAKKTYRKRRVMPVDAAWAKREFEKVDHEGHHSWTTESENPKAKVITKRQSVALIDRAEANPKIYGWTWEASSQSENRRDRDSWGPREMQLVVWYEQEMDEVDLTDFDVRFPY